MDVIILEKIRVETNSKPYNIWIDNSFDLLLDTFKACNCHQSKLCIVTDDNVEKYHLKSIQSYLSQISDQVSTFVFPYGEENKNLQTVYRLYEHFIEHHLDRDSIVVALGGGVTGDLAGFAAASYMRGIRYVQIPTSLLAQVDSSIGGKTGVDFMKHKNCVGAFWQPEFVFINTQTLGTLPERELNAGMAEVIKHGLIHDADYFYFVMQNHEAIKNLDSKLLEQLIRRSCEIKGDVVSKDEKENGLRATLNFGHTIGHAIERLLDFKLLHGECVSIGMVAAAYLSSHMGYLKEKDIEEIKTCLGYYHLPLTLKELSPEVIYDELFYDKKTKNNVLKFIVLKAIGSCEITTTSTKSDILHCIETIYPNN